MKYMWVLYCGLSKASTFNVLSKEIVHVLTWSEILEVQQLKVIGRIIISLLVIILSL